jgi:hypothetical protein
VGALKRKGLPELQEELVTAARNLSNPLYGEVLL